MSKTSIPDKVKLQLVARAAGQCQYRGCGKVLHTEDLTGKSGNFSHFAHIVADSERGPRGDKVRSRYLGDKLENLMFLCFDHHRLIDSDDVAAHPESLLLAFKLEHEERIRHLLSIDVSHRTKLLFLAAPIGMRLPAIDIDAARRSVALRYPIPEHAVIDLTNLTYRDDDPTFWALLPGEIQRQVDYRLSRAHGEPDWHALSVFALAPIPLLMLLGQALGDIRTVSVHQKLRNPDTWHWQDSASDDVTFSLDRPSTITPTLPAVVLALSISGAVHANEIEHALDNATVDRWELRASRAEVDVVRTYAQLEAVGTLWRQALHDIRATYGPDVEVHLFPAIPNSVAIECGRRLLPKADPTIHVYDRTTSGFVRRCQLLPRPGGGPV